MGYKKEKSKRKNSGKPLFEGERKYLITIKGVQFEFNDDELYIVIGEMEQLRCS